MFSYSDSSRQTILTSATYPQGFSRLNEIQKTTIASFKALVSKYRQGRQKQLWDLTRYPDLPALLLDNKTKSEKELNTLLQNYPKSTRKGAIYFTKHDDKALMEVENIRLAFESQYKTLIKDFPSEVQPAFKKLLQDPELISLLSDDIGTTIELGDLYKRNPDLVKHAADSVHAQIVKEDGEEYKEWKNGISKDTLVQKELKRVSKKYADENASYDDDAYKHGDEPQPEQQFASTTLRIAPYPYWAGYPYWYQTPNWYPYPWWYQSGFYWNPYGSIVFFGMPSYHFGWWYYSHAHYYNAYPRTSHYFNQHYNGFPRSSGGFNRSVRDWNRGVGGGRMGGGGRMSGGGRTR